MKVSRGRSINTSSPIGLALVVASLVGSGCGEGGATDDVQTLVVALSSDSANAQPISNDFTRIGRFVTGSLLRPDSQGVMHPQVAQSVEVSPDLLSLKIRIREGATFSDKTPIIADDVASSLDAHADPKFGGAFAGVLRGGGYLAAKVIDIHSVRVDFRRPWEPARNCLAQLGIWPASLIRKIAADPKGTKISLVARRDGTTLLVGAGPYRVEAYEPKTYARLVPVGEGEPLLIRILGDDAALTSFREGSVDAIYAETRRQPQAATVPGARVMKYSYPEAATLAANVRRGTPTGDHPALRRAIFLAVDPEALRRLVKGSKPARASIYGQSTEFNAPDAEALAAGYDPIRAARLLDEAGFAVKDGRRTLPSSAPLSLTVATYSDVTEYPILADAIVADLREVLEIDARTTVLDSDRFEAIMYGKEASPFDLVISEWPFQLGDFLPGRGNSTHHRSIPAVGGGGGQNWIGLADPEVDRLVELAEVSFDPIARQEAGRQLHRRLLSQDLVKPLYLPEDAWVFGPRIAGFDANDPYMKLTLFRWPERFRLVRHASSSR